MLNNKVLEVFTGKSVEQILAAGGSQSWVVNPKSMRGVAYCVCTRNDGRDGEVGFPPNPEPSHSAFLVGKVAGLRKVEHRNGRDRYLVRFSEYAVVDSPIADFRHGSTRNPVVYSTVEQCLARGLDIDALDFIPMPSPPAASDDVEAQSEARSREGISIAEAKQGLAIYHGVPIDNVHISITG